MNKPKPLTEIPTIALTMWLVAVIGGTLTIAAYSNTPGPNIQTVVNWPANTTAMQSVDSPTVVLFLHPKCPCSWSTLREFERALGDDSGLAEIRIGLFCPAGKPDVWTDTKLSKFAEKIHPGSTFVDRSATEAKRFGVLTSGHVMAFSASGKRLFSGGITTSRGHDGENRGSLALRSVFQGDDRPFVEQPVFGCPIIDSSTLTIR